MQKLRKNNKAAIELSIGTIVVVVLAMSMLILGLVLVKNIMTGSINNVDQINEKVKGEINKLFVEDKTVVLYLKNGEAQIKQGGSWGIAFGIKNLETGTTQGSSFTYDVEVSDSKIEDKCGITKEDAELWITTGKSDEFQIAPGKTQTGIVRFNIPTEAPLCTIRFHMNVQKDAKAYQTEIFDITTIA
ncbi:MAG: hypothetical protein Q7S33_04410 [Nanoarchaeota archaeon]|nr:hypothetical protein [Nanoarchaeota archaeon]